jgi:hypothetical protein
MKKVFLFLAMLGFAGSSYAQLTDEEYAYVTMDLQGILNLSMTTDPTVNFTFKSVPDYRNGITKFNATKLEVDATVAWDLFAYASTNNWVQVDAYSTNGQGTIPAEILEVQAVNTNASGALNNFDSFVSLKGLGNSQVTGGVPKVATQFLAGMVGTAAGESYDPGSAAANPTTNQFRIHYRIQPYIPARFLNSTVGLASPGYAQSGYYYLEVVYALVEDL